MSARVVEQMMLTVARVGAFAALVLLTACTIHHPAAVALLDGVVTLEFKPCGPDPAVGWVKVTVLPPGDDVIAEDAPAVWEATLEDGPAVSSFPLVGTLQGYRIVNRLDDGIQPGIEYAVEALDPDGVNLGSMSFRLSDLKEGAASWEWGGTRHHDPIEAWRMKAPEEFPNAC